MLAWCQQRDSNTDKMSTHPTPPAEQARLDMQRAREQSQVNITLVRNFIHGMVSPARDRLLHIATLRQMVRTNGKSMPASYMYCPMTLCFTQEAGWLHELSPTSVYSHQPCLEEFTYLAMNASPTCSRWLKECMSYKTSMAGLRLRYKKPSRLWANKHPTVFISLVRLYRILRKPS